MDEITHSNKIKILNELQKNARASLSELADKTGLTRQTVAKTICNMEKKNEIWGYTAIYDPKIVDKKPFILIGKLDMSIKPEEFLKKVTNPKMIEDNEKLRNLKTTMFLHGSSDVFCILWVKDIVEAKKFLNLYKNILSPNLIQLDLIDVLATFRNNGITNPNMVEEWKNLLL